MAEAVLIAMGSRNNTRRDSTKNEILLSCIQNFIRHGEYVHCKPECMALLLTTIC